MNGFSNMARMRRLRQHPILAETVREASLEPRQMILPFFAVPGPGVRRPIQSLHGVDHISPDRIHEAVDEALEAGIKSFLLFGLPTHKDALGTSAKEDDQPVQQALRTLRERYGSEIHLTTDVCLCEYTDHGHCGFLTDDGAVENDSTIEELGRIALSHARAGADMVAPSAMMDGQVAAIRSALDEGGFSSLPIMSYSSKFASAFYGPFRDAAGSAPSFGDRRSYQMSPFNAREALRESLDDEEEGADILMVKPSLLYMDVLARLREATLLPLACYLVSGEYMMLRHAANAGSLDWPRGLMEAHLALRRAGADIIITYGAVEVARMLNKS
ncbi:MAG: porphobilinogen synthase [Synergistaceae bacterium]|nr:porphobilinogen synthase [Synergistaceae bacterium]